MDIMDLVKNVRKSTTAEDITMCTKLLVKEIDRRMPTIKKTIVKFGY